MSDSVLFKDHGLFLCTAQRVARDGHEVFYHSPNWENGAPTPDKDHIGYGVPGITIADTFEDCLEEEKPGLIVYPDVGFGSEQVRERRLGSNVFGTGRGEVLEDDRLFFRKILQRKKLPCAPYEVVTDGIDSLRESLKKVKDKWIKMSMYRGIGETFYHEDYERSLGDINDWAVKLGLLDREVEILICDPIKTYLKNIGIECFVTDAGYLESVLWGFENKNSAYLGKACLYKDLPFPLKQVADAFLPVYQKYKVRGALSMEGHCTEDNKFYYDDPCMRFGSPPGEGICETYTNFSAILKAIAEGKLIKPIIPKKYVAEVMLQLREPAAGQVEIKFPEKYYDNIKIRNLCKLRGKYIHLAQDREPIMGAVVATANSIEDAQDQAMEIADTVKGHNVYYDIDGFDEINDQLKKLKKLNWEKF